MKVTTHTLYFCKGFESFSNRIYCLPLKKTWKSKFDWQFSIFEDIYNTWYVFVAKRQGKKWQWENLFVVKVSGVNSWTILDMQKSTIDYGLYFKKMQFSNIWYILLKPVNKANKKLATLLKQVIRWIFLTFHTKRQKVADSPTLLYSW